MANFDKSVGQGMEQKTPDKLNRLDGGMLDMLGFSILVGKGYLPILKGEETVIGYSDPMGVAAEIFKHVFGMFDWFFNVNDPVVRIKAMEQFLEALG